MLAMPVSAGSKTVTFSDRQGDLANKSLYCWGQGSHVVGDPNGWFSGNSPVSDAGYLDMRSGWISIDGRAVNMGLTVASPVPTDGKLPQGISEVRWAWLLWTTIDTTVGSNYAPYGVYIIWNDNGLSAVFVDRTSGSPPYMLTYLDANAFSVEGSTLTASIRLASIPGVIAWFCETIMLSGHPWPLDQNPSSGGWNLADLTDFQGPLAIWWPWQAMP